MPTTFDADRRLAHPPPHSPVLPEHRVHDYRHLVRRWRAVAKASGLIMRPFATASGHRAYVLRRPRLAKEGGLYISAGIHGDEPAATEAMIRWAEARVDWLRELPCLLFPCLNPWGLINNCRYDESKRDLNRAFHDDSVALVRAWKQIVQPYKFEVSLTLHEDYDGQGLYIYEIERVKPFWGEDLLALAPPRLPIEGRTMIDGRKSAGGLVRRRINPKKFPLMPEALYLHLHHTRRSFTVETPSEFSLDDRVAVQMRVIEECVRRAF